MVLVTTAVELCPALHTQVSVLIMRKLLGTSSGMELKGKRERGGRGGREVKAESGEAWRVKEGGRREEKRGHVVCERDREREREKQREGKRDRERWCEGREEIKSTFYVQCILRNPFYFLLCKNLHTCTLTSASTLMVVMVCSCPSSTSLTPYSSRVRLITDDANLPG